MYGVHRPNIIFFCRCLYPPKLSITSKCIQRNWILEIHSNDNVIFWSTHIRVCVCECCIFFGLQCFGYTLMFYRPPPSLFLSLNNSKRFRQINRVLFILWHEFNIGTQWKKLPLPTIQSTVEKHEFRLVYCHWQRATVIYILARLEKYTKSYINLSCFQHEKFSILARKNISAIFSANQFCLFL